MRRSSTKGKGNFKSTPCLIDPERRVCVVHDICPRRPAPKPRPNLVQGNTSDKPPAGKQIKDRFKAIRQAAARITHRQPKASGSAEQSASKSATRVGGVEHEGVHVQSQTATTQCSDCKDGKKPGCVVCNDPHNTATGTQASRRGISTPTRRGTLKREDATLGQSR